MLGKRRGGRRGPREASSQWCFREAAAWGERELACRRWSRCAKDAACSAAWLRNVLAGPGARGVTQGDGLPHRAAREWQRRRPGAGSVPELSSRERMCWHDAGVGASGRGRWKRRLRPA